MNPPTLKFNSFVKPNVYTESKIIVFYYTSVLAIFSLNFGFVTLKSPKLKFLMPILCLCQISGVTFLVVNYYVIFIEYQVVRYWYFLYLFKYWALSIGSHLIGKYTFLDFWKDLRAIHIELGYLHQFKRIENVILTLTILTISYRCITSVLYCYLFDDYCISSKVSLVSFQIPLICVDVFLITYFIIFYSMYRCMVKFINIVKNGRRTILNSHYMYKIMIDVTENGRHYLDYLYLFPLIFHTVDVLLTVFLPLIENEPKPIAAANVSLVQVLVLLFLPAFAAGLLTNQAEKLLLVLHDKLLIVKDYNQMRDIERFIGYVSVRRFQFTICRVIPLDWKLPIIILDLCITYLIVMLQLTHKY